MGAMVKRTTTASISVVSNGEILEQGFQNARRLWNQLWWLTFGYNEKLRLARGESWETFKRKRPRGADGWPGKFRAIAALADYWAYRELSDRCASYTVAEFDVALKSWWSNLKRNPNARPPRPTKLGRTLTFEVGRNAKPLGDWRYRLTVLGGCIAERHVIVQVHVRPGVKMASVGLLQVTPQVKRGRYQVSLLQDRPAAASAGAGVAGLDLGIVNLGALALPGARVVLYNGGRVLDVQRFANKRAAACKPSGYTGTEARLPGSARKRSYHLRGAHSINGLTHAFTTDVIRECVAAGVGRLAVGNLTGIREGKDFGPTMNQKLHGWTHGKVREQLRWKGEEHGIEVIEVSEAYTSQTCAACGCVRKANRVERGLYRCRDCGAELNADANGALNIRRRLLEQVSPAAQAKGVGGDLSAPPSLTISEDSAKLAATLQLHAKRFDLRSGALVWAGAAAGSARCNVGALGPVCGMQV